MEAREKLDILGNCCGWEMGPRELGTSEEAKFHRRGEIPSTNPQPKGNYQQIPAHLKEE